MTIKSAIEKIATAIAPSIKAKLADGEARQAALEAEIASLALDEELGLSGMKSRREKIEAELGSVTATVVRLRHAMRQALDRDRRAAADARAKHLRDQLARFEKIAADRHAAMLKVCASIERATAEYKRFLDLTESLRLSLPDGVALPPGTENMIGYAQHELAGEMYRHSNINGIGKRGSALPGARSPSAFLMYQPKQIESAADIVAAWNMHLTAAAARQIDMICEFAGEQVEAAAA